MNSLEGKILMIDRRRGFGFLEHSETQKALFFWRGNVANWEKLELYDTVKFEVQITAKGRHQGKEQAIKVTKTSVANQKEIEIKFGKFDRWIGTLDQWDGEKGYFDVEHLSKLIFIKHTTLAFVNINQVTAGNIFVINPVESNNPKSHYYTRFAYPLNRETNVEFLIIQYQKLGRERELSRIESILLDLKQYELLWKAKCDKAIRLEDGKIQMLWLQRQSKYLEAKGFKLTQEDWMYAVHGDRNYFISLWLQELHEYYTNEDINAYFIRSTDDLRFLILNRLHKNPEHQLSAILNFINTLESSGELKRNRARLEHILLLVRNADIKVLNAVKDDLSQLINLLSPHDQLDLWLKGNEIFINIDKLLGNIDFKNTNILIQLLKRRSDSKDKLTKIVIDHFFNIITPNTYDEWYPYLIPVFKYLEKGTASNILQSRLKPMITSGQWFQLCVLGFQNLVSISSVEEIPKVNEWPLYTRIRCYLLYNKRDPEFSELKAEIINELANKDVDLMNEACQMRWNQVLTPCISSPMIDFEVGYIEDLLEFQKITGVFKTPITGSGSFAAKIFESNNPWETFHARLWLKKYVPRDYYNYVDFRIPFRGLSKPEKKDFKSPSDELMLDAVTQLVIHEIPPCETFEDKNDHRIYHAKILNIHFENGRYRLKTPQGFTDFKDNPKVKSDYNFISRVKEVKALTITLHVKKNAIITEYGLDEVKNLIINEKLKRSSLGFADSTDENKETTVVSYTDDLILQERILSYLRDLQSKKYSIVLVSPHIFESDVNKEDDYSKRTGILSALFSIEHWENIIVVWEFYHLEAGNATYIFKTKSSLYEILINRLIDLISSSYGIRRLISSKKDQISNLDPKIVKNIRSGVGYISNFKVKRGENKAFEEWVKKLKKSLDAPIPVWIDDTAWVEAFEFGLSGKKIQIQPIKKSDMRQNEDSKVGMMTGSETILIGEDENTSNNNLLVKILKPLNEDLENLIIKLKL